MAQNEYTFDTRSHTFDYEKIDGTTFYVEPGLDRNYLDQVYQALDIIPEAVRKGLSYNGVNVYITQSETDSNMGGYATFTEAASDGKTLLFEGGRSCIVCFAQDEDLVGTILHEVGHQFDYTLAGKLPGFSFQPVSSSEEWENLRESEWENFSQIDELSRINVPIDEHEAYAEAFRLYHCKPEQLINVSPETAYDIEEQERKYEELTRHQRKVKEYISETRWDVSRPERKAVETAFSALKKISNPNIKPNRKDKIMRREMKKTKKLLHTEVSTSREAQDFVSQIELTAMDILGLSEYAFQTDMDNLEMQYRQFHRPQRFMEPSKTNKREYERNTKKFKQSCKNGILEIRKGNFFAGLGQTAKQFTEKSICSGCVRIIQPDDISKETAFVVGQEKFLYDKDMNPLVCRFDNGLICASTHELRLALGGEIADRIEKELEREIGQELSGKLLIAGRPEDIAEIMGEEAREAEPPNLYTGIDGRTLVFAQQKDFLTMEDAFEQYGPLMLQLFDMVDSSVKGADEETFEISVADFANSIIETICADGYDIRDFELIDYLTKAAAAAEYPDLEDSRTTRNEMEGYVRSYSREYAAREENRLAMMWPAEPEPQNNEQEEVRVKSRDEMEL